MEEFLKIKADELDYLIGEREKFDNKTKKTKKDKDDLQAISNLIRELSEQLSSQEITSTSKELHDWNVERDRLDNKTRKNQQDKEEINDINNILKELSLKLKEMSNRKSIDEYEAELESSQNLLENYQKQVETLEGIKEKIDTSIYEDATSKLQEMINQEQKNLSYNERIISTYNLFQENNYKLNIISNIKEQQELKESYLQNIPDELQNDPLLEEKVQKQIRLNELEKDKWSSRLQSLNDEYSKKKGEDSFSKNRKLEIEKNINIAKRHLKICNERIEQNNNIISSYKNLISTDEVIKKLSSELTAEDTKENLSIIVEKCRKILPENLQDSALEEAKAEAENKLIEKQKDIEVSTSTDNDDYFDEEEQLSDEEIADTLKVEEDSDRKITNEYLLKYKNLSLEELQDKYVEISNQMKNANTDNDLQELIQQRELIENQIKHKGGATPLEQNSNSVDMSSKSNDNETSSYNLNLDHFDKRIEDILSRAYGSEYSRIGNHNENTIVSTSERENGQRTTTVSPTKSVDNEETIVNELPENQEIEENVLTSNNEENTNKKKKIKSVRKSIINMAKKIKMHIATLGVSLVLLTAGLVAIKEIKNIPSSAKVEAETLQTKSNDKGISTAETQKDTISILGETNSTENQTEKETISDIDNSIDTMLSNKNQILEKQGDGNLSNSREYQTDDENQDYQTIETENKADISLAEDDQSQTIQMDFNDDDQIKLDNTTAEREIQTNQNYDSHIKIGDEVTISGSGNIFETASKAYMYEDAQIPYYGFEAKRVVIGVAIETNEQGIKVVYAYDPEANQKINSFLEQGGNIVSILTANKEKHLAKYDGSRALTPDEIRASVEGWYNATDVNKNQVKGKSR